MISLSCCTYKGYSVIAIIKDGSCVLRDVSIAVKFENRFSESLSLFSRAFTMLKVYIENNGDEEEVVIESKNKTLVKWLNQGYATEKYNEEFINLQSKLEQIPIKYLILHRNNLVSMRFADKNKLSKSIFSSLC